jgi:Ca-activated chloride channel family protein
MKRITVAVLLGALCALGSGSAGAETRVRVYSEVDRPYVPAGGRERVIVKVGLKGILTPVMPERVPLNVAIVLDKSGSMRGWSKIENAKLGAIEIVKRLSGDDIFSLVVYSDRPQVIVPAQRVANKDALIETISGIYADGRTALYAGVAMGAQQVARHMSWDRMNRIILLSDGLANVGPSSTDQLEQLGRSLAADGITVTTIGVGLDYNEDLMTSLAAQGGGNAYFAGSSMELPRIFAEEIGEAMTLTARDVRVKVICSKDARPVGIIGREGEISGPSAAVSIGKLYGKRDKYALFEVELPGGVGGDRVEIAEIEVKYVDPLTNRPMVERQDVSVVYDSDPERVEANLNLGVIKEAALTRTSETRMEAVALSDRGDYRAAAELMRTRAIELEKVAAQCDNDVEILEEARACDSVSNEIEANRGHTRGGRKKEINAAFGQMNQQSYISDREDERQDKK